MKETEKIVSSVQIEEKKRAKEKIHLFLISAASVIIFLGIWETAVRLAWVNPQFVCSPSEAFLAFVDKLTQPNPDGAVLGVHIFKAGTDRLCGSSSYRSAFGASSWILSYI